MTIDLPPELETRLREQAARAGVKAEVYVLQALAGELLKSPVAKASSVSAEETRLLLEINSGLPGNVWDRYHDLVAKRRAETLTLAEHEELVALSDRIEEMNARRLENVAEYARVTGTSAAQVLKDLGIAELAHV